MSIFFFFKNRSTYAVNSTHVISFQKYKRYIYNKIAKICSQEIFNFINDQFHNDLLKIEKYLTSNTEKFQSPQNILSNLIYEYYNLLNEIHELKKKKLSIIDNQIYELRQKIVWTNIKKVEFILKIKEDLAYCLHSLD